MKKLLNTLIFSVCIGLSGTAFSQDILESVAKGCEAEINGFCSQVTPGEGRFLACLYAHGDQVSGQCEHAIFDAAAQLERYIGALTYVANECAEDLLSHCAAVEIGEGRVAQCLLDHQTDLMPRCQTAIEQTGMAVE